MATIGACSLYESVGEESVAIGTVKLLCLLGEDVAILVDFHQQVSHELFVHRVLCAGVVAEGYAPSLEEVHHMCVVLIC